MTQELTNGRPNTPRSVTIENARIFFRNFAGREGQYNQEGDRNFGVALPPDIAQMMKEDGWNVKQLRAREEGDEPQDWVPVAVSYRNRPPRVVMIKHAFNKETNEFEPVRVTLPEDLVEMVDYADIANVDLILNPYTYNVNGRSGVKAYLKSIFVTINMDALEIKYGSIRELDINENPLQIEAGPGDDIIEGELVDENEYDQG